VAVTAVGVRTDEVYRVLIHALLAEYLPFGLSLTVDGLTTLATVALPLLVVAVPAAYVLAVRRVDDYRIE
jgi:hypothetical protein